MLAAIKQVTIQRRRHKDPCRFWNTEMSKIKRSCTQARRLGNWNEYRMLKRTLKQCHRARRSQKRRKTIRMVSQAANPWKYLYRLRPDLKRKYRPPKAVDRSTTVTAQSIAEGFAAITNDPSINSEEHKDTYEQLRQNLEASEHLSSFRPISTHEVYSAAKRANPNSSAGKDRIPPKVWAKLVDDQLILEFITNAVV